jgi:hypothetical protein
MVMDKMVTADDFDYGDVVIYFGMQVIIKDFLYDKKTYQINGIVLDQCEEDSDPIVVRPDNYKFIKKL